MGEAHGYFDKNRGKVDVTVEPVKFAKDKVKTINITVPEPIEEEEEPDEEEFEEEIPAEEYSEEESNQYYEEQDEEMNGELGYAQFIPMAMSAASTIQQKQVAKSAKKKASKLALRWRTNI